MALDKSGKFNPFYRPVDQDVQNELNKRGEFYGSRVRSQRPTKGQSGFPEAERLLWSYGKIAYAIITGGGITLGSSHSRVMSDRGGNLTLYDSTRNQPKYPLLQSVELSNEGTIGSLLKGSFSFTIYPDISKDGFMMEGIENAFFKPGKEVQIKYGWSVRDGGPNNGQLTGIIYNFDWSVNQDLSITAKCSIVSKATIAIGVSGEQTNPDPNSTQTDPLAQPIPDGDLAGIIEKEVKNLGGTNNKSVTEATVRYYPSGSDGRKLSYFAIGMPMSLADLPDDKLSETQKTNKSNYQRQLDLDGKKQEIAKKYAPFFENDVLKPLEDADKRIADEGSGAKFEWFERETQTDGSSLQVKKSGDISAYKSHIERVRQYHIQNLKKEFTGGDSALSSSADELARTTQNIASKSLRDKSSPNPPSITQNTNTQANNLYNTTVPDPIVQPIYYVKLGDLTEFINTVLSDNPMGKNLFKIQCFGNTTQYLVGSEDKGIAIVSSAPEEVYFPDEKMGAYGEFKPFGPGAAESILKSSDGNNLIDIGNILISTTTVIDTYRSFVKENQTSIEYKNITGFFDELIKKVNYASGEMYQLATQLLDPPKGGTPSKGETEKAILTIEDMNLAQETTDPVVPYGFYATIAKPILKSVSITSKPPAASAAAAFTEARGGKSASDVSFSASGSIDDFTAAKQQIEDQKGKFKTNGAGPTFSTGLKGNYARYKRSSPQNEGTHWLTKVLYPIDLSITIDGIDGFKFGDVIKTNLIPARYNQEGMVFVITKISHTIQNGVWETTLNTKARIDPNKLKA
jgi:hypothetical protein